MQYVRGFCILNWTIFLTEKWTLIRFHEEKSKYTCDQRDHLCPSMQTYCPGQTRLTKAAHHHHQGKRSKIAKSGHYWDVTIREISRLPKAGPKFQDPGPNVTLTRMYSGTNMACCSVVLKNWNASAFLTIGNLRLREASLHQYTELNTDEFSEHFQKRGGEGGHSLITNLYYRFSFFLALSWR